MVSEHVTTVAENLCCYIPNTLKSLDVVHNSSRGTLAELAAKTVGNQRSCTKKLQYGATMKRISPWDGLFHGRGPHEGVLWWGSAARPEPCIGGTSVNNSAARISGCVFRGSSRNLFESSCCRSRMSRTRCEDRCCRTLTSRSRWRRIRCEVGVPH